MLINTMKDNHASAISCAGKNCVAERHRLYPWQWVCCIFALSQSVGAHSEEAFLQDSGPDGLVSMEAEGYDAVTPGNEHSWTASTVGRYSGSGALMADPNIGTRYHNNSVERSPRLDYQVTFNRQGQHFLWIRSRAESKSDDTVNAGINGLLSATGIVLPKKDWGWTNQ